MPLSRFADSRLELHLWASKLCKVLGNFFVTNSLRLNINPHGPPVTWLKFPRFPSVVIPSIPLASHLVHPWFTASRTSTPTKTSKNRSKLQRRSTLQSNKRLEWHPKTKLTLNLEPKVRSAILGNIILFFKCLNSFIQKVFRPLN